jgi:PAS domain S-box-containing protein
MTLGRAFLLWIVGFLVLILVLVSALLLRTVQQTLEDELRSHAEVMARSLASAMAAGNLPETLPVLAMRDMRAIEVRDGHGRLLWAFGPEPAEVMALDTTIMEVRELMPVSRSSEIEGNQVEVVLLVSRARARQQLAGAAIRLLGGLAIALVTAMVFGLILVGRVVGPLNELASHARTFHPDRPLRLAPPTGTTTEVADLARAFSEMAERLAAQRQALSASEQRFRELFAGSPTPLLELDKELRVVGANLAAAVFLAAEPDECAGLLVPDFLAGIDDTTIAETIATATSRGEAVLDGRWRLGDGELAEVEVHLRPIADDGATAFLAAIHDLTDRVKRMGERWRRTFDVMVDGVALVDDDGEIQLSNLALQPHLSTLEPEIRARAGAADEARWQTATADERLLQCALTVHPGLRHRILVVRDVTEAVRAEARLREMQKMEAVETLASGVAHDFNNLIAGILLHVRWLLRQPEQAAEAAAAIQALAKEGEGVVRELLIFSRSEQTPHQRLDLAELVREQETLLGHLLPDAITLRLDVCREPVPVSGNPVALRRVILNLVLNARDAVPAATGGMVGVRIRCSAETAVLQVIDNGKGIPEEHREHLFEPFFSLRREGRGAGLGLAVVHSIVSEHDGEISVHTEPDMGTCIEVRLPLCPDSRTETEDTGTGSPKPVMPAGGRVLLVEQDGRQAARLIEELAAAGLDVRHARSPAAAEEITAGWPPDVVVTGELGETEMESTGPGRLSETMIEVAERSPAALLAEIRQALQQQHKETD